MGNASVTNNGTGRGFSYADYPVTVSSGCSNSSTLVCLILTGVGALRLSADTPLQAGQVLDQPTLDIEVKGQVCGESQTQSGGYSSWAEVDEADIAGSTVNAVAYQYYCSNSAVTIQGTIAYNMTNSTAGQGYYLYDNFGNVYNFGNDGYLSYLSGPSYYDLAKPIVGMDTTPDGGGYWMVASDGGVFTSGDAAFHGSTGGIRLNQPIVGMATDPATGGYWLVASDGGIFAFDAPFYGSTGGIKLNKPVVGMAATPDGRGYWLVASDGGIFAYGDARFYGSTGGIKLNQPVNGMTVTPDGRGYWFVASDGGIFAYGDARFYGSTGGVPLVKPVVGMESTADGKGYWLVTADGGLFNYGDASFHGSLGGQGVDNVVGMRR